MLLLHFVHIIIPFVESQCLLYLLFAQPVPDTLWPARLFYKLVNMFCIVSCYLALNHVLPYTVLRVIQDTAYM